MLKTLLLALVALVAVPVAARDGIEANARKSVASMLATGHVVIGTDGAVLDHELSPELRLAPALVKFVGDAVRRWRFEPVKVDGQVARARVPMSLRLVAASKTGDDDQYNVRIESAYFGNGDDRRATDYVRVARRSSIKYPDEVSRIGGKGTVYLLLQIGPDGKVMNVDAEQVNLRVAGTDQQMERFRKLLADASIRSVRRWTFTPPTTGPDVGNGSWLARQAVEFNLHTDARDKPGKWDVHVPGPHNLDMPWAEAALKTAARPDAMPEGALYSLQQGAKLLTPPST